MAPIPKGPIAPHPKSPRTRPTPHQGPPPPSPEAQPLPPAGHPKPPPGPAPRPRWPISGGRSGRQPMAGRCYLWGVFLAAGEGVVAVVLSFPSGRRAPWITPEPERCRPWRRPAAAPPSPLPRPPRATAVMGDVVQRSPPSLPRGAEGRQGRL